MPCPKERTDKKLVDAAITAYNALMGHSEELVYVDEALITRFNTARKEYNVSVAENKIAHLFDMYCNEYSFNIVKDARATYLALTAEEQALVGNSDVLTAKISELTEAIGRELDFNLTFAEHLPEEPSVTPPPVEPPKDGVEAWVIVLIVCASVVVAAGIAVGVIVFIKKKRAEK